MDVSLCVSSYRPGGLDLLFESLADMKFDGKWECIFADELHPHRKQVVDDYMTDVQESGFDWPFHTFKHVPAVPHEFTCPASTMNTSVRHSSGKLILIVGDYSLYPSDYLQKHWDYYKSHKDATLVSSYIDLETPEIKKDPKVDDYSIFKEQITKEKFLKQEVVHPEERHHFVSNWLDTKRGYPPEEFVQGLIGIPKDLMWKINGFDEETYNGGKGYSDRDVVHRAMLMGHRFVLDLDLRVFRCAHPHKKIEDLKWPFTEKKNYRTREENFNRFLEKVKQLSRRHILVNSHKGIRDLEWLNSKRILVQGGGAEVCTRKWVKILQHAGLPVYHNDMSGNFMFRNITDIIVYGVSPFDFQWTMPYINNSRVWMWWGGTDVYNVINNKFGMEIPKHPNLKHLAVSERLQKELESVGIESDVILDYEDDVTDNLDALDKEDNWHEECYPFTVLIYMPSGDTKEFYHYSLMKEIVEHYCNNDSIKFIFYGNKDKVEDLPTGGRCFQYGYITGEEKKQLYKETYVYLRHTTHDGIPYILVELEKMGRHVIMNYPYPHCVVAYTKDEIIKQIDRLYKEFRDEGRPLDIKGKQYYRQKYTKDFFINEFIRLFWGEECLKKWEGEE